ncbi:MAG: hypothetical protein V4463_14275 [Pseudomonadota bacterium]
MNAVLAGVLALSVATQPGKVLVQVSVENHGARPVKVLRALLLEKELEGRLFEVSADGQPVPYIGMMVKRGAFTAADYVRVKAHGKRHNTIDITHSYQWLPGEHRYEIRYGDSAPVSFDFMH